MTTPKTAVKSLRITDIVVPSDRKRAANPKEVKELASSISTVGLLNPIIVTKEHRLVAGLHRLRAAESLGWKEIPAAVVGLSRLDAELVEIDENLCRSELTELERSKQILRRKRIYEERHPESKYGAPGALASNRKQGRKTQPTNLSAASFTRDTVEKTGTHERAIERHVQIAQGITSEVDALIHDTPLADNQSALLALSGLSDDKEKLAAAQLVVSGEAKTVREALTQLHADAGDGDAAEAEPVRDHLGQVLTDPEIAEAFTLVKERIDTMVGLVRHAARAWGSQLHKEMLAAKKLRVVEAKAYMATRNLAEHDLKMLAGALDEGRPYALCPYCKGEPLPADRQQYCQGCGGGGWVAKSTYDNAPPETQIPGTARVSRRRAAGAAEVAQ